MNCLYVLILVFVVTYLSCNSDFNHNVDIFKEKEICIDDFISFKKQWEFGWTDDWKLLEAKENKIDDFISGVILIWERIEDNKKRIRTDALTRSKKLYWAHEELYEGIIKIAKGYVYISEEGHALWRNMVYSIDDEIENDNSKHAGKYYELELIQDGKTIAVYKSEKGNFLIDGITKELRHIPKDTIIIRGKGPKVEELRTYNHPKNR